MLEALPQAANPGEEASQGLGHRGPRVAEAPSSVYTEQQGWTLMTVLRPGFPDEAWGGWRPTPRQRPV